MTSLTRTHSLQNLSDGVYNIILERALVKVQLFSCIDLICYFILTSLSSLYLCPLSFLNLLSIVGARSKNTCILNMGFIFTLSNIPVKIILIIYYKQVLNIIIGIISIVNSTLIVYYTCKCLSLISNSTSDIELTIKKNSSNPYISKPDPVIEDVL
jgi:hypothetical protein